ncbi:uncharacterized protein CLUP02_01510 [Colletotrichum lupini]|uniref:Uncharacterized protein n=1 Tax=Colletotrichum lupini TaxID=145971 RepID=A0A9Q8W8R4_9PEZI|nr:uncharacterized protein CLUP02_01510 [Colletotrichum lupini]UQC74858.1 hypothetical protein CLUP02_01510 [Colletotrichum lupini]
MRSKQPHPSLAPSPSTSVMDSLGSRRMLGQINGLNSGLDNIRRGRGCSDSQGFSTPPHRPLIERFPILPQRKMGKVMPETIPESR